MSRFDELRACLWDLEQELETGAERLRMEFAQRLADGGAQLRACQRAASRLLPYPVACPPGTCMTAPVIYGLLVPCWIFR